MSNKIISERDLVSFLRKSIIDNDQSVDDIDIETFKKMLTVIKNRLKTDGYTIEQDTMDYLSAREKDSLKTLLYYNGFLKETDKLNELIMSQLDESFNQNFQSLNSSDKANSSVSNQEHPTTVPEEKKQYYGPVTYLSDKPDPKEREKWNEWYSKLKESDREILRNRGEDPYDPWR